MSRPVTCTHHCGGCHSCFRSLEAFDHHRTGDYATGRYCLEADSAPELAVAAPDGVCRAYEPDRQGVVVYTAARSLGRAEEAFGRRGDRPTHVSDLGAKRERPEDPSAYAPARVAA